MQTFSVGVVGAGQIVRDVHLPVLFALPEVRVAWIADAHAARVRQLGRDYGIPAVVASERPADLPPCDVALLGIPTHVRGAYYEELARRRAAVFAEKPFAIAADDHERFAAAFPEHRVACGYMRRYYRATAILRHCVTARPFGALRAVRAAEGARATKTGFDATFLDRPSRDGGGVLWAIGCHLLDLVGHLTGAADGEVVEHDVVFDADTDREASAEIRFSGHDDTGPWSVPTRFRTSWLAPQSNRIALEFERATVSSALQPDARVTAELRDGGRLSLDLDASAPWATTSYQAFHLEWREFLDGVAHERPTRIAASTSLLTTRLIDRLLASRSRG